MNEYLKKIMGAMGIVKMINNSLLHKNYLPWKKSKMCCIHGSLITNNEKGFQVNEPEIKKKQSTIKLEFPSFIILSPAIARMEICLSCIGHFVTKKPPADM